MTISMLTAIVAIAAIGVAAVGLAWAGAVRRRRANRSRASAAQAERQHAVQVAEALCALQRVHARSVALFDALPDAVMAFDQDGAIESLNHAAAVIFRCAAAKTLGCQADDLVPDLLARVREMTNGAPADAVERRAVDARRLDGEVFPLEFTCRAAPREGGCLYVLVLRDLSAQQGAERLKHTFVAVVSHELRTPLTSIRGALALLADGSTGVLPVDAQAMVVMAARNCERLVDLVSDILDLDRMRTGQLVIEPEVLDLIALLRETLRATLGFARLYKVRLLMPAQQGPVWVRVDPRRMAQVMGNLLSNAIKFSPEGGDVSVRLQVGAGACAVCVVDQGPGIPVAFRARVFERFAQADATNTRARGGSGLGLSITRALVERMDGHIDFECPDTGGSIFRVALPIAQVPARSPDFSATGMHDLIV
ncbi:MAG: PAS domain S-box protein [Burkholderiales bacterium]|nr:PAS domain S-box protein [Burkholderiales bacterium]MDE2299716.1 PAS domain S-box protein [Burkholderiales bacterium]